MIHHFTVDLEDWYHVSAFESTIEREQWPRMPSRVVASTHRLLDLLDETGQRATFFTLGWVAEQQPDLIRELVARGHELACHTWWHRRVHQQSPEAFARDIRDAKTRLEDIASVAVVGFRAPSFSIIRGCEWAFEELVQAGFSYDSSVFPIRRPGYGFVGAPVAPYMIDTPSGALQEYPLATVRLLQYRLPGAGGAYLRHLPLALVSTAIAQAEAEQRPAMLYVHPWEVDVEQPRLDVGLLTRWRHYGGLHRMYPRLQHLLRTHRFASVAAAPYSFERVAV